MRYCLKVLCFFCVFEHIFFWVGGWYFFLSSIVFSGFMVFSVLGVRLERGFGFQGISVFFFP